MPITHQFLVFPIQTNVFESISAIFSYSK